MKVLAIETSCDETAAAVVEDGREVLSNIISSQIATHKKFGGVVPEIASRQHVEAINTVLDQAIKESGIKLCDIDLVAATRGPGLVGALLVGLSSAKALAYAIGKPFIGVNHIYGHVCANYISHKDLEPPFIGLIVSGGHTYLVKVRDYVDFELIGRTRDDACGEAYDKVARAMGIGYPGGPVIDRLAKKGKADIDFPRVMLEEDSYDFSFSGLKTAVINYLHHMEQKKEKYRVEDVAASFQNAVIDVLVDKSIRLAKRERLNKIVIAGGVSANSALRERLKESAAKEGIGVYYPDLGLCTDNAAMIGSLGYYVYKSGKIDGDFYARPNLSL
ncbi:tRNA (adenosine(37)-N6)-threonylcarbamoyltransferase complex transferase subunit TsaD [Peptoniphilus catoniae]|uniref:tRNA (adenosine(37)-N6)-threonylcarbamoyltransferase complex transferase subunit TsaD n=1 Tax=Peptoniphilus catoniae TaxID=1660341 RepID=UPI0010FEB723|nr:tRNA (adenosine(37)-N6)-threonylcarbamoyltransferase complex transferase subunit TsaD [Peptoniphilus catoniae]